jgi:hypothetical protein
VSIQEVGIEPDIELVPTRVTADRVNVFAPRKTLGEADLEHHFGNSANNPVATKREEVLGKEKPFVSIRYLKEDAKQKTPRPASRRLRRARIPSCPSRRSPRTSWRSPPGRGRTLTRRTPIPTSWTRTSTTSSTPKPRTR